MNLRYMLSEKSLLQKKEGVLFCYFIFHEFQIQAKLYGDVT